MEADARHGRDLDFRIVAGLARHGIEIPFPQRDLHLRSPGLEQAARAWAWRVAPAERLGTLQCCLWAGRIAAGFAAH